jgi:Ca2+-binding RTX toxin-like protein
VETAIHHHRRTYDAAGNPLGLDQDIANTNLVYPPDYPGADVDHYLTLKSGAVLHTWWKSVPNLDTTYGVNIKAAHAEIVGITPPIRLDHIIIETKGGETNQLRASELDDGRIVFTWLQNSAQLPLYPGNTQALILNSDLHGFTRPGTDQADTLEGSIYNDRIYGLDGDDTLIGNAGPDILDGGLGLDTADYRNSLSGVDVSLTRGGSFQSGGHAQGDDLRSIENLTGSAYGDVLTGDDDNNIIHGSYGNDQINGGGGSDTLYGDQGKDTITVREDGTGTIYGGKGGDTIRLLGNGAIAHGETGDDDFLVSGNDNTAHGGLNVDTFSVIGSDNTVFGDEAGDTLRVEAGAGIRNRLFGGPGDDTLRVVGGSSGNFLDGGPDTDVLTGGAGRDFLNGGPGDNDRMRGAQSADVFAWVAGGGTDIITDFNKAEGDKIDLSGSGLSSFSELVMNQVGPDTEITLGSGLKLWDVDMTTLKPHDFIFSALPDLAPSVRNDADGDGKSDILFSHQGAVFASIYEWQMNNRAIGGQGGVDLYDPSFTTLVTGDFNGDGRSDILFQNPGTGGVWQWQLDGTTINAQGAVDVADPSFTLRGTADFNGDGTADVLFRNDAGFVYQWQMDGLDNTPLPVGPLDPSWRLQGAGDFDGDHKADLLMRSVGGTATENGAYYIWGLDGASLAWEGGVDRPDASWHTLGLGDFNGDGLTDVALRNESAAADNGAVWIWLMTGQTILAQAAAGIADPAIWHLSQIGDLNGDGKDDILYRNDAGTFYSWNMNGTTIASEAGISWAHPSYTVLDEYWQLA